MRYLQSLLCLWSDADACDDFRFFLWKTEEPQVGKSMEESHLMIRNRHLDLI
jgi:hypothetical protein